MAEETSIDHGAYIGISSFGFGGSNAHVIIKGVEEQVRKTPEDLPIPFDKNRAQALSAYYRLDQDRQNEPAAGGKTQYQEQRLDIRGLVEQAFSEVTNIREIDPALELTDQGLDLLGATQFVTTLQEGLGIELDIDLLFDYPLVDQLIAFLEKKAAAKSTDF